MVEEQAAGFSLADKYLREEGRIYLSGTQALVRLPFDQHRSDRRRGLRTATYISGYPGSPLGGFDLELQRQRKLMEEHHVHFSSGLNEEIAATAVFGSQMVGAFPGAKYDGVLGMWYGKGPGLDRAGDALRHFNLAGVGRHGGVLALVGDDPTSKSSTIPSGSEIGLYNLGIPTLYPGNVQEILDLGLHGFMLSRAAGLVVGMKIVTNVADGTGTAEVSPGRVSPVIPAVELDGRPFIHTPNPNLIAPLTLELERTLHYARLEAARRYARENRLNRIVVPAPGAWLGILTAGKAYYDVRQALEGLGLDEEALQRYGIRLLKMGMTFPVEQEIIREFAGGLREILVVEEKRPFLEVFAKEILYGLTERPVVVGKFDEEGGPLLPIHGELDPELIARAIAGRVAKRLQIPSVARHLQQLDALKERPISLPMLPRTPYFCSGCPHNTSTLVPAGSIAGAGIGCSTIALLMDRNHLGVTQMGGEGAQWIGMSPFTEVPHIFQNMGDGTMFHSGALAINAAVACGVNLTFKILYNGAVALTGGQNAKGELPVPALVRRLEAEGVKQVIITTDEPKKYRGISLPGIAEVWHRERILEAQTRLAATLGVTVLIHDQQCAAEKRRLRKRGKQSEAPARIFINERVCEGCGDCGKKSNCLSVHPVQTEFGRKTQIHQSSCNKDASCLAGDCPSFITVEPLGEENKQERRPPAVPRELPEPDLQVSAERFALQMLGIGGTGVVTVNQILGTAALLEGRHVQGLDQTGLSQKAGPVVSDLKLSTGELQISNKVTSGEADLYLGLDLLVAADERNLTRAAPGRTIAVVSTSQVPTGKMVTRPDVTFPQLSRLQAEIERATRCGRNVYLDSVAMAEGLFGDHMAANMIMLGAAYQAGALPISSRSIEAAVRLNGVAVEVNLLAFQWGRMAVVDPAAVEAAIGQESAPAGPAEGLARLLERRVPELIAYQDEGYARRYVEFVERVARAERQRAPGLTRVAEAVARNLFKLMAYKDEYEVARLHLDAAVKARIKANFGQRIRVYWHLHPPLLRALGMKKKIRVGAWFTPVFQVLRGMKRLRGTPLDIFGYAGLRRVERGLIDEYRGLVEQGLAQLTPENYETVVKIAELPDVIRGYEDVKLASVEIFREQARYTVKTLCAGSKFSV